MRIANSIAWLTLAALAIILAESSLVSAALINVPSLYSCAPADIRVLAKGNYTIEGRDLASHKLVFRAHVDKGVRLVTWDAVELVANATAVITVTDQTTSTQTAVASASAVVHENPVGNSTCLHSSDRSSSSSMSKKSMVATIIGIVLGAFVLLVLLLVAGMMYRRKKEKGQKFENDSLDLNHNVPQGLAPGSSYMSRLVPGLKMQEAKPLPRDPVLESEQANYASTRRGTQYYKNGLTSPEAGANGFELPSYRQSQSFTNANAPHNAYYRGQDAYGDQQQWNNAPSSPQLQHHQPSPAGQAQYLGATNPFASQPDLSHPSSLNHQQPHQQVYLNKEYGHSQTSFLSKKSSLAPIFVTRTV